MVLPGDGNFPAQASLTARVYTRAIRANEALYCVYEAKKAAERVTSVGHVMIRHVTLNATVDRRQRSAMPLVRRCEHGGNPPTAAFA
jgi:hypothetical protein